MTSNQDGPVSVSQTQDEQKHEQMYYTACRVRAGDAGGSGICFYSGRDADGNAHSLILTNHHVVEGLISIENRWDSTLKREYPQEERDSCQVEFFTYNDYSKAVGIESYQADIVAWDDKDRRDIAVLKLREKEETMDYVADLYPYNVRDSIYMFDRVYAVGAALGYPVFQTPGEVTNAQIELGGQKFVGTNSPITFGNSGGGLFKEGADGNYYLIGLPARVSMEGFGSVSNHIGFAVPIESVYNFLDETWFNYVWDDNYTIEECEDNRIKQQREAKEKLLGRD